MNAMPPTERSTSLSSGQWWGLALGPLLGGCCFVLQSCYAPAHFPSEGRITLAIMVWMATWWLTEATHVTVTALLPLVLFPLLGATSMAEAAAPYAHPLIFLYFGGFVIALSMERWGLGTRVALTTLRWIGTNAGQMVAGFMLVTALFSGFVSNTATAAMMLPIAASVIVLIQQDPRSTPEQRTRFSTCLMLGIAYAASIGGITTIVGTPSNAFLVGFLRDAVAEPYRRDIGFVEWLPIGLSISVFLLPLTFFLLTRVIFPVHDIRLEGGEALIRDRLRALGPMGRGEWNTLVIFLVTVTLWLTRPLLAGLQFRGNGMDWQPLEGLTDTGVALLAALALFLLPVDAKKGQFTMNWETATQMPWGVLLLFGGGLSLAAAVRANGVAEYLGSLARGFGGCPTWLLILLVTSAIVYLTELTSNTATTASLVPVLAAMAPELNVHPYLVIIPATLGASCAFMLPVATPPNAIIFGSGAVSLRDMIRAGMLLNAISIALITLAASTWLGALLGI